MKVYNFIIEMVHDSPAFDIPYTEWLSHGIIRENSYVLEIITTSDDFESPITEEPIILASELDETLFRRWLETTHCMYGRSLPKNFSPKQLVYALNESWKFRWNYFDVDDTDQRLKWFGKNK